MFCCGIYFVVTEDSDFILYLVIFQSSCPLGSIFFFFLVHLHMLWIKWVCASGGPDGGLRTSISLYWILFACKGLHQATSIPESTKYAGLIIPRAGTLN